MRTHLLARWPLVAGLALIVGACSDITRVNENPNSPKDLGPEFLFPQAIRAAVENTYGRMLLAHASIWAQQTVQLQYPDEERGRVRSQTIQAFWNNYYAGAGFDVQTVINKGRAAGQPNIEGLGLIWKTWIFQQITDLWGDAPYTQALTLTVDGGISTPVYDPQQAIYRSLIDTLKYAVPLLNPAELDFGDGDILYGNDLTKWTRFANSLRMRLAMRLSEVDPLTAQAEFVAAHNDGGFESNDDNAMLRWPGPPYQNLSYENRVVDGRDDDGISKRMVDTLLSLNDPRLQLYAEPADSPATPVTYNGLGNNIRVPPLSIVWYSRIGNFWRFDGAATPTAIMTYSEVLFLEAEAAERGWILTPADAGPLYVSAIRANMTQYTALNSPTPAEIDAYVIQPSIVYAGGAAGLEQIQLQKWISLFMQGSEAFANQRRTDMPRLVLGPNITFRPVRFPYPAGEQSLNLVNMQAAVTRQMPQGDALTLQGRV
ncbi:MAG: SusD/RagB family nutrient-binding outer membrane lipoprotein, partial [bacterium]